MSTRVLVLVVLALAGLTVYGLVRSTRRPGGGPARPDGAGAGPGDGDRDLVGALRDNDLLVKKCIVEPPDLVGRDPASCLGAWTSQGATVEGAPRCGFPVESSRRIVWEGHLELRRDAHVWLDWSCGAPGESGLVACLFADSAGAGDRGSATSCDAEDAVVVPPRTLVSAGMDDFVVVLEPPEGRACRLLPPREPSDLERCP